MQTAFARVFICASAAEKEGVDVASFHMSVKTVSRSGGRSATAAAAYRSGEKIECAREGVTHDYTRRQGVIHTEVVTTKDAPKWAKDREKLWNAAEKAETRKNSTVAREFVVALPASLTADQRKELIQKFAREIADRHKVAVDVAIHAPDKQGDQRNHHAHLMLTTRQLGPEGLGAKTRELDVKTSGEVDHWRERWAEVQNQALEKAGLDERVDHRSHAERGIQEPPLPQLTREEYEIERGAKQQAERTGQDYEPVTAAGANRHAVEERRNLKAYIEKGTEWLKSMGQSIRTFVGKLSSDLATDKNAQDIAATAADRQIEQTKSDELGVVHQAPEQAKSDELKAVDNEPELEKQMDKGWHDMER